MCSVAIQAMRPVHWRRPVRASLFNACVDIGLRGTPFVLSIALLVGIGAVFQRLYGLDLTGQNEYAGTFLVLVLVREVAPLLVLLIVLGRSGTVMLSQVNEMHLRGELRVLEAQGIDPFVFLLLPRTVAAAVCSFCLLILFIVVALTAGYVTAQAFDASTLSIQEYMKSVLARMNIRTYALVLLKPTLGGAAVAAACSGMPLQPKLLAGASAAVLPTVFVYAMLIVFLLSGILSILLW